MTSTELPVPPNWAFGHYSFQLPSLFPIQEELCKIEYDTTEDFGSDPGCSAVYNNVVAVICGNALTIMQSPKQKLSSFEEDNNEEIVLAEMEFENLLTNLTWDVTGKCLVIADLSGTIHIVKIDGTVLFSKKVFPGTLLNVIEELN